MCDERGCSSKEWGRGKGGSCSDLPPLLFACLRGSPGGGRLRTECALEKGRRKDFFPTQIWQQRDIPVECAACVVSAFLQKRPVRINAQQ